jgi:hypothetical protein
MPASRKKQEASYALPDKIPAYAGMMSPAEKISNATNAALLLQQVSNQ